MKKIVPLLSIGVALLTTLSSAQAPFGFQYSQQPTLRIGGRVLSNAWAGGLNSCQFAQTRLNDDTRPDLVVFDRTSFKVSTFLATDAGWQYAPDYEIDFPPLQSWLALADYDNDGLTDLFTPITAGLGVFRHVRVNGRPSWQLVANPLMTIGLSSKLPLYVSGADIPAVVDLDNDGDIDILTFDETGNRITYFKNRAVENHNPSHLSFKRIGECWGNFRKEYCNDFVFDLDCSETFDKANGGGDSVKDFGLGIGDWGKSLISNPQAPVSNPKSLRVAHSGNALAIVDTDGDGLKDVLFGFVSCTNLTRLRSLGPNSEYARFAVADTLFPAKNPINFPIFPAAYSLDVTQDGLADLIASPNIQSNDFENGTDFQASNWLYQNIGTAKKPAFKRLKTNFLQDQMLDIGEDAAPALADLDGDGDLDLLLGGKGQRQADGSFRATLRLFTNQGTPRRAAFVLTDPNYLQIPPNMAATNLEPMFADVDGNGTYDLVVSLTTPTAGRQVWLIYNSARLGSQPQYRFANAKRLPLKSPIVNGEHPAFADIDHDGKPDLLVGNAGGNVSYYRNVGTGSAPSFILQTRSFGGLGINMLARFPSLVVADLNQDHLPELLVASRDGGLRLYAFADQPDAPLTLLDSFNSLSKPGAGLVASVGDLDGDQLPDLLLGTLSGGVRYLKNTALIGK